MLRQGLAVIIGFAVWSVMWAASNELLVELHALPHDPTTTIQDPSALLALLVSGTCSTLAAGYAAAVLNPSASMRPVLVLGALLVLTGLLDQADFLDLTPIWYRVAFLALLLPACVAGAKLHKPPHRMKRGRPAVR